MFSLSRSIVLSLLFASLCVAPLASINAQESRDRRASSPSEDERRLWPTPTNTIVSAPGANDLARLAAEPVMRIALSTDAGAATISTAAHLLKASELDSTPPQPLDATRVRVESRLLSSPKQTANPSFDLSIARSLSREEADRLVNTVKELTGDNAHAVADGDSGK